MTSVLIGIPTLNGPERLDRCLTSVAECTRLENVSVVVCDDASTAENLKLNKDCVQRAEVLRERAGLEMIVNEHRSGISTSWNKLVQHRRTDAVALLNDDIEVVPHWLDVLVYSLEHNPSLGMVSPNVYVGLTKAQHASAFEGIPAHVRTPVVDYHEANLLTGDGLLSASGACFAFRRSAYDEAGGFDMRYFCFYEEVDFGVTLRAKRYFHAVASYPIVYHMGGATTSDPANMNASEELLTSRQKFREKWGGSPADMQRLLPWNAPRQLRIWNSTLAHMGE